MGLFGFTFQYHGPDLFTIYIIVDYCICHSNRSGRFAPLGIFQRTKGKIQHTTKLDEVKEENQIRMKWNTI